MTTPRLPSPRGETPKPASPGRAPKLARLLSLPLTGPLGKLSATLLSLIVLSAIGVSMGKRAQANGAPHASPGAPAVSSFTASAGPRGSPDGPAASAGDAPLAHPPAPAASGGEGAPSASEGEASPSTSGGVLADGRVVLNLATEEDLRHLSGIGPSRARAILALRQRLGKFRQVSDLLRVKGLGRKTLARLAPKLLVDPPPAPPG